MPQPQRPVVPGTITAAVVFMYMGFALQALGVILNLIGGAQSSGAVAGGIGALLWFRMAVGNRAGRRWARTASTVLFGRHRNRWLAILS